MSYISPPEPTIPVASSAPAVAVDGQMYYSSTDRLLYVYNGTAVAWRPVFSAAQQAQTVDLKTALVNVGVFSSTGGTTPLNLGTGALTVGSTSVTALQVGTSTTLGNVLTADASGNATWQAPVSPYTTVIKYVTADVSMSSTTAADITGLTGITLAASGTYSLELYGTCLCATSTNGVQVGINSSATNTNLIFGGYATSTTNTSAEYRVTTTNNTMIAFANTNTAQVPFACVGALEVGASGGSLAFRQASEASGTSVTIKRGTWCRVTKIS